MSWNIKRRRDGLPNNTGFIEAVPSPTDFIAGAETGIETVIRVPGGSWEKWLPAEERQNSVYFDTFACVSFSALNCVETFVNWMVAENKIGATGQQKLIELGLLDQRGRFNASDRYTAKMSGTGPNGNTLYNVANSVRHDGILAEADWPYPVDQRQPVFVREDYYREIPAELQAKAKEVYKVIEIFYEWAINGTPNSNVLASVLPRGPVQVAGPVCKGWSTDVPVSFCQAGTGHATTLYATDANLRIFDHYAPYRKSLIREYHLPWAMQFEVVPARQSPISIQLTPQPVKPPEVFTFTRNLSFGQKSKDIEELQKLLRRLKFFPERYLPTGYYGPVTTSSVLAFQKTHKVAGIAELLFLRGRKVGPKTRAKLNELQLRGK